MGRVSFRPVVNSPRGRDSGTRRIYHAHAGPWGSAVSVSHRKCLSVMCRPQLRSVALAGKVNWRYKVQSDRFPKKGKSSHLHTHDYFFPAVATATVCLRSPYTLDSHQVSVTSARQSRQGTLGGLRLTDFRLTFFLLLGGHERCVSLQLSLATTSGFSAGGSQGMFSIYLLPKMQVKTLVHQQR